MQNKPNFRNDKMNVSSVKTMNYEQITMNNANKNKPNTNPIKPNIKRGDPIYLATKPASGVFYTEKIMFCNRLNGKCQLKWP